MRAQPQDLRGAQYTYRRLCPPACLLPRVSSRPRSGPAPHRSASPDHTILLTILQIQGCGLCGIHVSSSFRNSRETRLRCVVQEGGRMCGRGAKERGSWGAGHALHVLPRELVAGCRQLTLGFRARQGRMRSSADYKPQHCCPSLPFDRRRAALHAMLPRHAGDPMPPRHAMLPAMQATPCATLCNVI